METVVEVDRIRLYPCRRFDINASCSVMPVDLHYICQRGENHRMVWDKVFDTGNWTALERTCELAVGGRVFLHEKQKSPAWHGGTIVGYRSAPTPESHRKVFTYEDDIDYRVLCPVTWSQQSAVVWWNDDRTSWMTRNEYLRANK
jgi:hypothetical protein